MKKQNEVKCFLYVNGQFIAVASNDRRIQYWNPDAQEYNYQSILSAKVYAKDLHVHDSFRRKYKDKTEIKKRGIIKKYSFGASRRCKFFLRNTGHLMEYMVNLTYPNNYPMDGLLVKKQLHKFLGWLHYHGYKYLWVLEFQDRGAPHFHLLVDKEITFQEVIASWYKIVGSNDPKHLERGAVIEPIRSKGAIGHYMTSYLEKPKQKTVPLEYQKVGRFWGHSDGLLKENKMKIFGNRDEIANLKRELKIAKQFDRGQKRIWEKRAQEKAKETGIQKKKYKKFHTGFTGFSLRLTNSDKLYDELLKRDIVLWPYTLTDTPSVPSAPTTVVPWDGRGGEGKKNTPHTQHLPLEETYEEYLKRIGLY
jgi:hypothetical protein